MKHLFIDTFIETKTSTKLFDKLFQRKHQLFSPITNYNQQSANGYKMNKLLHDGHIELSYYFVTLPHSLILFTNW